MRGTQGLGIATVGTLRIFHGYMWAVSMLSSLEEFNTSAVILIYKLQAVSIVRICVLVLQYNMYKIK